MPSKVSVVNFGSSNASLSTVGYVIYKEDETVQAARTTTGVSELGTATGIYRATINYPVNFRGFVLWDTGEATPNYASESINPLDADSIADEMRTMLRSLNTSLSSHLEKLFGNKKPKKDLDFSPIENKLLDIQKMITGLEAIWRTPQASIDISNLESTVAGLKKDSVDHCESVEQVLRAIQSNIDTRLKMMAGEIRKSLSDSDKTVREIDLKADSRIDKKLKFVSDVLDRLSKEMLGDIEGSVEKLIKRLEQQSKAEDTLETLMEAIKDVQTNGKRHVQIDPNLRNLMIGLKR